LTIYEGDEDIYQPRDAGASGYLLKDMLRIELIEIIRKVHQGYRGIPRRSHRSWRFTHPAPG
jgi:DNA-binding NarL/FixJ family response regulator